MNERKPQRPGGNSVTSHIQAMSNAGKDVDLPDGITLRTEEELTIWRQFSRARSRADWRDMDLILLSKVVRLEADLRKYQAMLDETGPVVMNQRGTEVESAMLRVIDTMQRQQLAIIRSMSLNASGTDSRTQEASAKQEAKAREVMKKAGGGVVSLLAVPN